MTRILAIGECMVEMAPTDVAGTYKMGFAGDTMNTAWYLRRLLGTDHQVDYFSAVGTDSASDQMLDFLEGAGIGTDHIARSPNRTVGLYIIQLNEGERSFSYWRDQSAARTLAQDGTLLENALMGADVAFFSGITVAILPKGDRDRFLAILAAFKAAGGTVVFDPNLRPKLWKSKEDMTSAIMQAAAVSSISLPSHEDEAEWFGDADSLATAARYAKAGARTVLVKNGPAEILIYADNTVTTLSPEKIAAVVDTTAAGDSFNAGYLAAIVQGASEMEAAAAGAVLAGKVIRSRGALVAKAT
jgi:2-dehydro-3-deoxygluconokinase